MLIFINHDDMRSLECMEECIRRHYYVSDQLKDLKYADVIYLGVKGLDRKNRLFMNNETIMIDEETIKSLKKGCCVLTLIHNAYLQELSKKYQFIYQAFLDDEGFIKNNSILTAEGLISYLISHRRYPLYQSHVMVLGYGHCGKAIVDALLALKADVSVVLRNQKYRGDIEKKGCHYSRLSELDLSKQDILINTIPSVVVEKQHLDQAKKNIMIVDVASYPYGIDHHYAISKGMNSQILPSIPSKYAYGYAGRMMADIIERMLKNE